MASKYQSPDSASPAGRKGRDEQVNVVDGANYPKLRRLVPRPDADARVD